MDYNFIKKILSYLTKKNSILVFILVIFNTLNILSNYKTNRVIIYTAMMAIVYLTLLDASVQDKIVLLFIFFVFSITTIIGESIVISTTKGNAIRYGVTSFNTNVPVWLFSAYFNMVVAILFLQKFGSYLFLNTRTTVKT